MGNIAIHKADELPSDARRAVERVLGRVLEPDDEVSIMAFSPHDAPTGEARQQLARQLEDRITRTAASVRHIPEDEQEAAIDDAVNHVRANPK
ncbi:MAG: hypothetical protein WAO35_11450 [Terriglobia bacterium]